MMYKLRAILFASTVAICTAISMLVPAENDKSMPPNRRYDGLA
jgi:hypothetical protein